MRMSSNGRFRWLACLAALVFVFARPAAALDSRVQAMGDAFVGSLPAGWSAVPGSWTVIDVANCIQYKPTCFGSNPSSPYSFAVFADSVRLKMAPSEAIVVFLRTPPPMRYYGFTQYLFDHGTYDSNTIFGSLSDTASLNRFVTLQSSRPGENLFDQYAVIVWTADMNSLASIKPVLAAQGIRESEINFIPLPIGLPLNLGNGPTYDDLSLTMRMALPNVPADMASYIAELPFYVVKVGPASPGPVSPAPIVGYASETSGVVEDASLASALSTLMTAIKRNYSKTYAFKPQKLSFATTLGWDCITGGTNCNGDNHDALYSLDLTQDLTVTNLNDIVIVAGVNHRKTGKATYLNHSVVDPVKTAGIVSVEDTQLTSETALYHAGIKRPNDPRIAQFSQLYAYAISYDCTGLKYCLSIPAPTPGNPVGLQPGATFRIVGRSYVDPNTGVRPSLAEIVPHQSLVGTRK